MFNFFVQMSEPTSPGFMSTVSVQMTDGCNG